MKKIDMRKFCDEVAVDYAKERIEEEEGYKKDEWTIVRKYIKKNHKILDLCCGPGTFLIPLTKQGYNIEGIDFSKGMLKKATEFAKKEKVKIRAFQGGAINIKRKENSYDTILLLGDSIGAIPNSEDRQKVFDECHRILKEDGILIITLGNRYSPLIGTLRFVWIYIKNLFINKIEFGDCIYDLYGKKGIHHYYSKKEALVTLEKSGFKIKEIIKSPHKFIFVATA